MWLKFPDFHEFSPKMIERHGNVWVMGKTLQKNQELFKEIIKKSIEIGKIKNDIENPVLLNKLKKLSEIEVEISVLLNNVKDSNKIELEKDIMKKESLVSVGENMSLRQISHLLTENDISSIPIVGKDNEFLGVISEKDILKAFEMPNYSRLKAKDIMKKEVACVKENDYIEVAIRIFEETPYRILPVLRNRIVTGTLSRNEVLSACIGEYY